MTILGFLAISALFSLATSLNSSFSQTNFYVSFNSRVSSSNPLLGQYEEVDMLPLLRTISTRFCRILTDGVSLQSQYRSIELISTATARLNKETNSLSWMSPESLRRWEFTEKSDVWAYGVTLWEIYSLGRLPYSGFSWTIDFPCKLVQGLRLEEPEYNADNMYELMLKCWSVDPEERPTFLKLKKILSTQECTTFIKKSSHETEFPDDAYLFPI